MRIVIKLSSQLTYPKVWPFARILFEAISRGDEIIVVAGGAVKRGSRMLGLGMTDISDLDKQIAAGVGQPAMMNTWITSGRKASIHIAQVQYTHHDLLDPSNNIPEVIEQFFKRRILCVANGNDVAIDEETRSTASFYTRRFTLTPII